MTSPRTIDFKTMSDADVQEYMTKLNEKRVEAIRIYRLARQTLTEVTEFYNFQLEKLEESRQPPPLPRQDSNHRGMD